MQESREEKLLRREFLHLLEQERSFARKQTERKAQWLERELEEKLPPGLQENLNKAFVKAFTLLLEQGTGWLEKTCQREKLREAVQTHRRDWEQGRDPRVLRDFSRAARKAARRDVLISGVSGIGMGLLGIGLPDIPVFTAMLLRSVYETALHYGYGYKGQEERYLVLLTIEGALSRGERFLAVDHERNDFLKRRCLPENYQERVQIQRTAEALSGELLASKFLQGVPLVGAAGGAYDLVCLRRVTQYAQLSYRRRKLLDAMP